MFSAAKYQYSFIFNLLNRLFSYLSHKAGRRCYCLKELKNLLSGDIAFITTFDGPHCGPARTYL